jgi:hypothetical protein
MLRFQSLFILYLLLLAPGATAAPTVIRLADHENGAMIDIAPTGALTVDFSGTSLLADPDHRQLMVQLQREGRSDYYSVDLVPDRKSYVLDAATLQAHESPSFPGFRPGGAVYLLIGKETHPGSLRLGIFDARWEAYLQVH